MPATMGDQASARASDRRGMPRGRSLAVVLGFLTTVLVVTALVGDRGLTDLLRARDEYRSLEADYRRAKALNVRLREEVRRLREDPEAIEELARRDLGLMKPGEKVFIIRDVPKPTRTSPAR